MKKKEVIFICLAVVFALLSCEYKADSEYYRELDQPAASIPLEINLSDVEPNDTIYITDVTRLTLKVNTYGKPLKHVQYILGNNSIGSGSEVIIYPNNLMDVNYKLTVVVGVSSGSGSLADIMGLEGYEGEMSWNIRILKNFDPGLKLGFRKNADNLLEFYWETSTYIPESIFEKYDVRGEASIIITDQARKNVIFDDYICGWTAGSVDLYIKSTGGHSSYYHKALSFESPCPDLYFETLDVNRVRVYWDKPFIDANFELSVMNNSQFSKVLTADTSVVVSTPRFPETWNYMIQMYPKNSTIAQPRYYFYDAYNLGRRFTEIGPYYLIDYYCDAQNILLLYGYTLYAVDLQSFVLTPLINNLDQRTNPDISCVPGSKKIALKLKYGYYIYHNDSYINPTIIYRSDEYLSTEIFKLTNADRLFVVVDFSPECDVYDVNTGSLLFSFDIIARPASRSVSPDGKYFCCASGQGLTIYSIGTSGVENVTTLLGSYSNALFNPANPQQLIAKQGNDIQVLEAPDFLPVYTHTAPNSVLLDVDPANGNILYHQRYVQQDSLHVIRTTPFFKPAFSVATYARDYLKLRGNLLSEYQNHNYFLDITPYLKP